MTMLTKIGNSQGIRIPKPIIKQAKLENVEIEFEVTEDGLLLKPVRKNKRETWEENIKQTLLQNKDKKDEALVTEFLEEELDEWEW